MIIIVAKTDKEKPHVKQPTAEQIRIAQITEIGSGSDDPKMREKVANLMETTQRTEEEVCCALYECDNDLDRAVIFLLETLPVVCKIIHTILNIRRKNNDIYSKKKKKKNSSHFDV